VLVVVGTWSFFFFFGRPQLVRVKGSVQYNRTAGQARVKRLGTDVSNGFMRGWWRHWSAAAEQCTGLSGQINAASSREVQRLRRAMDLIMRASAALSLERCRLTSHISHTLSQSTSGIACFVRRGGV